MGDERHTQKNPTFSHSQKPVVCLLGWQWRALWKEELPLLSKLLFLQSLSTADVMVLHTLSVSLSLSLVLPDQEECGEWRKGERQKKESESAGGCWWLKAAPGSIHMQIDQEASTNPREEKDYASPLPLPRQNHLSSHGRAVSQCGMELQASSKWLRNWPIKPISWIQLWFLKGDIIGLLHSIFTFPTFCFHHFLFSLYLHLFKLPFLTVQSFWGFVLKSF